MTAGPGPADRLRGRIVVVANVHRELEEVLHTLRAVGVAEERIVPLYSSETPSEDEAAAVGAAAAGAAGLVLAGGADIDPRYFGEATLPWGRVYVEPHRDALEWAALEGARQARTPIWGICRGLQVLNVFLGGTLWQDLPTQVPDSRMHHVAAPRDALVHTVGVVAEGRGTALGEVLGRETAWVNSRHHQAVKDLAADLVPVAVSADGLVEAAVLDGGGDWWVEAVEWHPENLVALAQQRALAQRFVDAVEARAA